MTAMKKTAKGIQSIETGYRLLAQFQRSPGPQGLRMLAKGAGMTPTKAYFYLTSFVRVGLLARTEDGSYRLGPNLLDLGLTALSQIDVLDAARAAMQELRNELGGDVFLSVWGSRGAVIVQRVLGTRWSSWEIRVGAVLPPLSATGRAFLAHFPEPLRRELIRAELRRADAHDPWHRLSESAAMEMCEEVRRHGLSRGSGNVIPGHTSLAAPVLGVDGTASAAITLSGDAGRFDSAYNGRNARTLLAVTRRLSHAIGGPARLPAKTRKKSR